MFLASKLFLLHFPQLILLSSGRTSCLTKRGIAKQSECKQHGFVFETDLKVLGASAPFMHLFFHQEKRMICTF